jgi:hypothetical protein
VHAWALEQWLENMIANLVEELPSLKALIHTQCIHMIVTGINPDAINIMEEGGLSHHHLSVLDEPSPYAYQYTPLHTFFSMANNPLLLCSWQCYPPSVLFNCHQPPCSPYIETTAVELPAASSPYTGSLSPSSSPLTPFCLLTFPCIDCMTHSLADSHKCCVSPLSCLSHQELLPSNNICYFTHRGFLRNLIGKTCATFAVH